MAACTQFICRTSSSLLQRQMCGKLRHLHVFEAGCLQKSDVTMNIFDRKAKRLHRDRAAIQSDANLYQYLREEIGFRVADRVFDIRRRFGVAVDLGCGEGFVGKHLDKEAVEVLFQCDISQEMIRNCCHAKDSTTGIKFFNVIADEEFLPFRPDSLDLVVSSLSLHWVNDIPGAFRQIHDALKNDGAFIAALFGGDTLFELRCSLQLSEMEREGGFAPHISPFAEVRDIGNQLTLCGYRLLTVDVDEIKVNYPSMFELMWDLKGMAENNASWNRKLHLRRDTLLAAAAIYKEMYGNEDGTVPATFRILYLIGWKADPSQAKPASRGSGQVSFKDISKLANPSNVET